MSAMAFVDGNQDPEVEGSTDSSDALERGRRVHRSGSNENSSSEIVTRECIGELDDRGSWYLSAVRTTHVLSMILHKEKRKTSVLCISESFPKSKVQVVEFLDALESATLLPVLRAGRLPKGGLFRTMASISVERGLIGRRSGGDERWTITDVRKDTRALFQMPWWSETDTGVLQGRGRGARGQ
ncbi:hypothetical protein EV363DRAFT_836448 [Boletus edulis]|nr:hypothetical protein EV363DRAFT_836448 [Boletus edulis]